MKRIDKRPNSLLPCPSNGINKEPPSRDEDEKVRQMGQSEAPRGKLPLAEWFFAAVLGIILIKLAVTILLGK